MDIRLAAAADVDAILDLRIRAFGQVRGSERDDTVRRAERDIADGRVLGVYDGGRLVASGRYLLMEQWWHGRSVPMGGVASVYVTPEDRGKGIGRRLANALIELMDGLPISVLYPATTPVYRSAGYELGGEQHWMTIPAEALRTIRGGPVPVRRVGAGDAAEIVAGIRRAHEAARDSGPVDWGEPFFRAWLAEPEVFAYRADDGFLAYQWNAGNSELIVEGAIAGSEATARALWAIVGSGSSIAKTVQVCVGPHDPMLWLLRDRTEDTIRRRPWMLRIVDAVAAVEARGFPAGVSGEVSLTVTEDAARPKNQGGWRLSVGSGRGRLMQIDPEPGALEVDTRGLAALYSGIPVPTLRRSGLASAGTAEADALLDTAFTATPYMIGSF